MRFRTWVASLAVLCGIGWCILAPPASAAPAAHDFIDKTRAACNVPVQDKVDFLWVVDNCLAGDREWWATQIIEQLGPQRTSARNFAELRAEFDRPTYGVAACQGEVNNFGWTKSRNGQQRVNIKRRCYPREKMLTYLPWTPHPSVVIAPPSVVLSMTCANPQVVVPLGPISAEERPTGSSMIRISKGIFPFSRDSQVTEEHESIPGTPGTHGRATAEHD